MRLHPLGLHDMKAWNWFFASLSIWRVHQEQLPGFPQNQGEDDKGESLRAPPLFPPDRGGASRQRQVGKGEDSKWGKKRAGEWKIIFIRLCHEVFTAAVLSLSPSGGLNLNPLKFLVFDWNWRDQKLRRMVDIPEVPCNQQLPLIFSFFIWT